MDEPRVGDLVVVEFWDHIEGDGAVSEPVRCMVYGECRSVEDWGFAVCGWSRAGEDDVVNETVWSIVRGAVIDVGILDVV